MEAFTQRLPSVIYLFFIRSRKTKRKKKGYGRNICNFFIESLSSKSERRFLAVQKLLKMFLTRPVTLAPIDHEVGGRAHRGSVLIYWDCAKGDLLMVLFYLFTDY